MGSFTKRNNNANDPAGIQKNPINVANVKNHAAKVNNLYK